MRKIFTLLLLVAGYALSAQQYNNEWIQHSQTYYKFKLAKPGIYRIPKSVLDAAGIGNTQVEFFELWRNGERVPFYPSVPTGILPADGYLEFWGYPNDGKPDKAMYRDPKYQHSEKLSLITDTATYFLSVNNNQSGFRVTGVVNDVQNNVNPEEPYFMYTAAHNYNNKLNLGFAAVVGEYVYSSSYDKGEYYSSGDIRPATPLTTPLNNLAVYTAGPGATFRFGASGNALNTRRVQVSINGTEIKDTVMDFFNDVHTGMPIPLSVIGTSNASVQFRNLSETATDRMVISYFSITYPRLFSFGGQANFEFTLPAKPQGYFLQITQFNTGGVAPVLYDVANGERYVGDIAESGKVRFALPGSGAERKLVLASTHSSNVLQVSNLTPRYFTDYAVAANQGDYLIVSNQQLFTGSSGNNPVIDYKNYRQSAAGGSYKVVVADIEELVDQFAFGLKKHPLSVRNFLRYARDKFDTEPKYAFLIGKGTTYYDYKRLQHDANADRLNLVPTFGIPGSDNLLSAENLAVPVATTPIGRLSVISGREVEDYLQKIKEYELMQKTAANTLADRAWMKNVVHVTGSSEAYLGTILCHYMDFLRSVIEDTLYGGIVSNFCKTSANPVEQVSSGRLDALFEEGISFLTYFGHSSSTTLEFNIDNPQNYNNPGKYPVFFVNGCNAGNFFTFNAQRLAGTETLSERFTLARQRGSIAFVASTHYGIVNYLNQYLIGLYRSISYMDNGKTLGELQAIALQKLVTSTGSGDFYSRCHAEEITLHGDPAIKINGQPKPDYVVESSSIHVNPVFISVAENSFNLKSKITNIGISPDDSVRVEVRRQYPNGEVDTLFNDKISGVRFIDSFELEVPIVATRDKGMNRIMLTVDPLNDVGEVDETNNASIREFIIYEDEARPVYPYNYSIIDNPTQKLYASTANPFSDPMDFYMEIDTTEAFNSPMKTSKTVKSAGGILEFDAGITYLDSVVYFWRTAPASTTGTPLWAKSSFVYIPNNEGFNQSHHFQHMRSETYRMNYDSVAQSWKYGRNTQNLYVSNIIYTGSQGDNDFAVNVNGHGTIRSACLGRSLVFNVFDSVRFQPWKNVDENGNNLYRFGSASANCSKSRNYNFEFSYLNAASRKLMMDFMDSIPEGAYVVVRSFDYNNPNSFSSTWRADTLLYGSNNSLYHKLFMEGFAEIDSINIPRSWIFIYRKGGGGFTPKYGWSEGINGNVIINADCTTPDTLGYLSSPKFGPAKAWKTVQWAGVPAEMPSTDHSTLDVIGIDADNSEVPLFTLDQFTPSQDISSIDANQYPYIILRMRTVDSVNLTPMQLKYWRVLYDPVPEGAMAPNIFVQTKDSFEVGEIMDFAVAFKNVSPYSFPDSVSVRATVLDNSNVLHELDVPKQKPIVSGDTAIVRLSLDTKKFAGNNVLFVDVNPDNEQPEQLRFNNFLYKNFHARVDKTHPFLDVTFDGVHILNRDIVSARPHIRIKLKDDAKYLLLNDTSLSVVQIKYPDGSLRTYNYDGDTLRFTPATSGDDNSAVIDFSPAFLQQEKADGDEYELIVRGKDRSNNRAGDVEYRVAFRVINKPMISNLLNYPNPFSTSTAFVFTITGSEIPQNIKIQILTVTGKIVREITKEELGPLHIGRNITEFRWDGTDQYGQKLGNGVYLYRVVTTMNGMPMEKYRSEGDDTDRYFTNGYGKMYLMR